MIDWIKVGAEIRHIKRESCYRVIAKNARFEQSKDIGDNAMCELIVYVTRGMILRPCGVKIAGAPPMLRLPVLVQVSSDKPNLRDWVIYQEIAQRGMIFARNLSEFTPDRFAPVVRNIMSGREAMARTRVSFKETIKMLGELE